MSSKDALKSILSDLLFWCEGILKYFSLKHIFYLFMKPFFKFTYLESWERSSWFFSFGRSSILIRMTYSSGRKGNWKKILFILPPLWKHLVALLLREGFKKKIKKNYGKFHIRGGGGGQQGPFSISNFFLFFMLQMA